MLEDYVCCPDCNGTIKDNKGISPALVCRTWPSEEKSYSKGTGNSPQACCDTTLSPPPTAVLCNRGYSYSLVLHVYIASVSPAPQCQLGTSVHKVHVNCVSHMTLRHLLTHLGCVFSRSLLLSQYNTLLLSFTAVHHIRQLPSFIAIQKKLSPSSSLSYYP
jgi:hypothetical protein